MSFWHRGLKVRRDVAERQIVSSTPSKARQSKFKILAESRILGSHKRRMGMLVPALDPAQDAFNQIGMYYILGRVMRYE